MSPAFLSPGFTAFSLPFQIEVLGLNKVSRSFSGIRALALFTSICSWLSVLTGKSRKFLSSTFIFYGGYLELSLRSSSFYLPTTQAPSLSVYAFASYLVGKIEFIKREMAQLCHHVQHLPLQVHLSLPSVHLLPGAGVSRSGQAYLFTPRTLFSSASVSISSGSSVHHYPQSVWCLYCLLSLSLLLPNSV